VFSLLAIKSKQLVTPQIAIWITPNFVSAIQIALSLTRPVSYFHGSWFKKGHSCKFCFYAS